MRSRHSGRSAPWSSRRSAWSTDAEGRVRPRSIHEQAA
jgi:hypothetical protein